MSVAAWLRDRSSRVAMKTSRRGEATTPVNSCRSPDAAPVTSDGFAIGLDRRRRCRQVGLRLTLHRSVFSPEHEGEQNRADRYCRVGNVEGPEPPAADPDVDEVHHGRASTEPVDEVAG